MPNPILVSTLFGSPFLFYIFGTGVMVLGSSSNRGRGMGRDKDIGRARRRGGCIEPQW